MKRLHIVMIDRASYDSQNFESGIIDETFAQQLDDFNEQYRPTLKVHNKWCSFYTAEQVLFIHLQLYAKR